LTYVTAVIGKTFCRDGWGWG